MSRHKKLFFAAVILAAGCSQTQYATQTELNEALELSLFCTEARSTYIRTLENCSNGDGLYVFADSDYITFRRLTNEERSEECRRACLYEQICRVDNAFMPRTQDTDECIPIVFTDDDVITLEPEDEEDDIEPE